MVKITIFLCVAILATASNAATLSSSLEKAQKSLNNLIESTAEKVKAAVEDAKQKSAELTSRIEAQTKEFNAKISEDIASKIQKALDEVTRLTSRAGDVDVSDCEKLGNELLNRAHQALSQLKKCFVDKSEQATAYVKNMLKTGDDTLATLSLHKADARACLANMDGFFAIGTALVCTNTVAAKAAWSTIKAVPAVSVEATKLTFLLTTLTPSLTTCTTTNALTVFYYESSVIAKKTAKCVKQKIDEVHNRGPSFADPTTPEIPVVAVSESTTVPSSAPSESEFVSDASEPSDSGSSAEFAPPATSESKDNIDS